MKRFQFTFNGTGADVFLCLGEIPDHVLIIPIGGAVTTGVADKITLEWWRLACQHDVISKGQVTYDDSGIQRANYAIGDSDGISIYRGGDVMTSTNQTSVSFGEGVYLEPFDMDMRYGPTHGKAPYDSVSAVINQWTLDTSGDRTGHFNEDVTGAYIGAGSRIIIAGVEYFIEVLTAGEGKGDDEVELNEAVATGQVEHIGPKWTTRPIPIGRTAPAGIKLETITGGALDINKNNETHLVIATMFDNR